ncbi:MAG: hypothetical protein Q4D60_10300, partial [Eubacteriales bacterium]|nr:hypothetical protein [Eubacteriales bacterium]
LPFIFFFFANDNYTLSSLTEVEDDYIIGLASALRQEKGRRRAKKNRESVWRKVRRKVRRREKIPEGKMKEGTGQWRE